MAGGVSAAIAAGALVLFGKKGTQPLLGAYSLEGLAWIIHQR